jgi:hypothetical protein
LSVCASRTPSASALGISPKITALAPCSEPG